eukprot:TRINITY_DN25760_c0_g1_i2.p1 TRINITY_DN25760_c0_g1~~TRINITY_DN25760_c0_g1_i2.p1  ORF type:complete len:100 (+),score=14.23 TRINITY_DN25760_c0_g1_i2:786-1085(+)
MGKQLASDMLSSPLTTLWSFLLSRFLADPFSLFSSFLNCFFQLIDAALDKQLWTHFSGMNMQLSFSLVSPAKRHNRFERVVATTTSSSSTSPSEAQPPI